MYCIIHMLHAFNSSPGSHVIRGVQWCRISMESISVKFFCDIILLLLEVETTTWVLRRNIVSVKAFWTFTFMLVWA